MRLLNSHYNTQTWFQKKERKKKKTTDTRSFFDFSSPYHSINVEFIFKDMFEPNDMLIKFDFSLQKVKNRKSVRLIQKSYL